MFALEIVDLMLTYSKARISTGGSKWTSMISSFDPLRVTGETLATLSTVEITIVLNSPRPHTSHLSKNQNSSKSPATLSQLIYTL